MKNFFPTIKAALVKTLIIVSCLGLILPGTALADTNNADKPTVQILSSSNNDEAIKLQGEIDKYLFETHARDIEQKGFKVTHTSPMNGYVEIGITPYNQKNADYLYGIFGKDKIKVVEGQQAALMDTGMKTTSAKVESTNSTSTSSLPAPLIYSAGIVLVGCSLIMVYRKRAAK